MLCGPRESVVTVNYALIGVAGYIAPRHLKAIKETDGNLRVAFDVNDSVGIMDSHFPHADFFTTFELFDSYVHAEQLSNRKIDFMAICSPNYLHKSHVGFALRSGSDAICEKPLVLNLSDVDDLAALEKETGRKVNTILQLRLHPAIIALRDRIRAGDPNKIYDVDLGYYTSRGAWYHASWKGFVEKSGGVATNIGIHLFDMLSFVFGPIKENIVQYRSDEAYAGYLEFQQARVRCVLSINREHLPVNTPKGQTTCRSIEIDGEEIEFSGGFTDLHTASYQNILDGNGYGLKQVRSSIEVASHIRHAAIEPSRGDQHPEAIKVIQS